MAKAATFEEGMHAPSWLGWSIMAGLGALCMFIGHMIGKLAGFPYYDGYQGVLVQQPWPIAVYSLLGIAVASVLSLRITVPWTRPLDSRVGAAISLLVIAGLSIRSGGILSVMQAADGRDVFWILAGESVVLLLVVALVFGFRSVAGGTPGQKAAMSDWVAAGLQAGVFALAMWVLGKSALKAQGLCAVLFSGVLSGFVTHLLIGRTWRGSWMIPLVVAMLGYAANAVTATGVDIAKLGGPFAGLSLATPLDYAAFGPIGIMIGELLHGEHAADPESVART